MNKYYPISVSKYRKIQGIPVSVNITEGSGYTPVYGVLDKWFFSHPV